MKDDLNEIYYDIILEENIFSNVISKLKNLHVKISDENVLAKCVKISKSLSLDEAKKFLADLKNQLSLIQEDAENEDFEKSAEKVSAFLNFVRKHDTIFKFLIPFYDGLITKEELEVLPDAFKSMLNGTWGANLATNAEFINSAKYLKIASIDAFRRIAKNGVKRSGKIVMRLTRRQLSKLASKTMFAPIKMMILKLCGKLTIMAAGSGTTIGAASTGAGTFLSILTAVATALYYIYAVLDVLGAVNSLLRMVAKVYIADMKARSDINEKGDKELDLLIDNDIEKVYEMAA